MALRRWLRPLLLREYCPNNGSQICLAAHSASIGPIHQAPSLFDNLRCDHFPKVFRLLFESRMSNRGLHYTHSKRIYYSVCLCRFIRGAHLVAECPHSKLTILRKGSASESRGNIREPGLRIFIDVLRSNVFIVFSCMWMVFADFLSPSSVEM